MPVRVNTFLSAEVVLLVVKHYVSLFWGGVQGAYMFIQEMHVYMWFRNNSMILLAVLYWIVTLPSNGYMMLSYNG